MRALLRELRDRAMRSVVLRRVASFAREMWARLIHDITSRPWPRIQHAYLELRTRVTDRDRVTLDPSTHPTVFLIAGWAASARGWMPFKSFLESRGYAVFLPTDQRNTGSVPDMAQDIALRLRMITSPRLTVVAHSLGGLTLLHALRAEPELADRIDRIILLGTPLRGTVWGWIAPWEHAFSHLRFERRARRLERELLPDVKKKIHLLTARWDEVVWPRPHLSGIAEHARLPVGGHLSLVLHPTVWEGIERRLRG